MPTLSDNLSLSDFVKIVIHDEPINLDEKIIERAQQSFDFLKQFAEDKVIYGVNTGFGPMAQYRISDEKRNQLQYNLIRSHATGMGNKFNALYAKATLLARLNSLALGKSAIHPQALKLMTAMLNKNIVPVVMNYWISFVKSLDPNSHRHTSASQWDTFGKGKESRILLETNRTRMEDVPEKQVKRCEFWKRLASTMEH